LVAVDAALDLVGFLWLHGKVLWCLLALFRLLGLVGHVYLLVNRFREGGLPRPDVPLLLRSATGSRPEADREDRPMLTTLIGSRV
jgi:hypothetical protein